MAKYVNAGIVCPGFLMAQVLPPVGGVVMMPLVGGSGCCETCLNVFYVCLCAVFTFTMIASASFTKFRSPDSLFGANFCFVLCIRGLLFFSTASSLLQKKKTNKNSERRERDGKK